MDNYYIIMFLLLIAVVVFFGIKLNNKNKLLEAIDDKLEKEETNNILLQNNLIKSENLLKKNEEDFFNRLSIEQNEYEELIAKQWADNSETQKELHKQITSLQSKVKEQQLIIDNFSSNLTAFPYMAGIVADLETHGYEILARQLDWSKAKEKKDKVAHIRKIEKDANERIEECMKYKYQLQYLKQLYPAIEDILAIDFKDLPSASLDDLSQRDPVRDFLSKEEWESLTETERNQLALNRYFKLHRKTKWQIGRDYELYIGGLFEQKEKCPVEYFGEEKGLEDLGRDLIVKKGKQIKIIQCKYWSQKKLIREKHITQLYGTTVCYCLENHLSQDNVSGILITNTELSPMAKKMADYLQIKYKEHIKMVYPYPCIKCNIGRDEFGNKTKIYHLPFDQQYDRTKIDRSKGEDMVATVAEAEERGFRRAYKWHGEII